LINYHIIEPEVAGGWGDDTEFTRPPGQPVVIHKFHYQFDGWMGDELLESTPCYIVSEKMAEKLQQAQLSGFTLDEVETTKSEQFRELYPDRELPRFLWLKVEGSAGQDDFGVTSNLQLVVSDRALKALVDVGISHALVEPFID